MFLGRQGMVYLPHFGSTLLPQYSLRRLWDRARNFLSRRLCQSLRKVIYWSIKDWMPTLSQGFQFSSVKRFMVIPELMPFCAMNSPNFTQSPPCTFLGMNGTHWVCRTEPTCRDSLYRQVLRQSRLFQRNRADTAQRQAKLKLIFAIFNVNNLPFRKSILKKSKVKCRN